MPKGRYHRLDPDGAIVGVESFSCAPGPAGWRYVSTVHDPDTDEVVGRVDVTVDADWRQVRVAVEAGGWTVRGGVVGPSVLWSRVPDGGEAEERAVGFTGTSPAFVVVTARLLRLTPEDPRRVRLLRVTEPALVPLAVDEGWALVGVEEHETDLGPLPVERYEVADLSTAERAVVHLAGDVVLEAPGVELADLESPPNLPAR